MNKRGFELVWSTVILIILGLVLLTTIILFFTGTFGSFSDKIKSYFTNSNVDSIVDGCNRMIESNQEYAFCCEKKNVKYYLDGEKVEGEFSCQELVGEEFVASKINTLDCSGRVC